MVTAAVSCGLWLSPGLALQAPRAQYAVASNRTGFSKSLEGNVLAWDPLQRRHAKLCSSSAFYRSCSSSLEFTRLSSQTQRNSRLRLTSPRASTRDDEELAQTSEMGCEDRVQLNVLESPGISKSVWSTLLNSAVKPAVVAVMMALLLAQPSEDAFAASGGRVGGKSFSKPSGPSRSYSGGGGGGGRAYSGGGYAAPPIYGSPYGFSPFGYSPFYGGGYGGGGLFLGPSIGFGGGGTIFLALIAFATVRAVLGFIRDRFRGDEDDDRFDD